MGAALELSKLSAVAWLGRYGGKPALRAAVVGDQDVMRWFILAVALLVDPAAVLLLLAAASARR